MIEKKLKILTLPVGQMKTNCYILVEKKTGQTIIVDPGDDAEYIEKIIRDNNLHPHKILATHGHFDHVMAVLELSLAYQIPFYISSKDSFLLKSMNSSARHWLGVDAGPAPLVQGDLKDGEKIKLGENVLNIWEIPGHTPGSIAIYDKAEKFILTGDLIFAEGRVGRTDFSYSDGSELEKSIGKILQLPGETVFYPGHGESKTLEEFRKAKARAELGF